MLLERNGQPLFNPPDSAKLNGATLTIRDTSIARVVDGVRRSGFVDGVTWLVRQQYGYADSMHWEVRPQLAKPRLSCPTTAAVGDTVRIGVVVSDANNILMTAPVSMRWSLHVILAVGFKLGSISQTGQFVATESGDWRPRVVASTPTEQSEAECIVLVFGNSVN